MRKGTSKSEAPSAALRKTIGKWAADIAVILFAAAVYSLGVNCFIAPNEIAPGGVTGIAIIIGGASGLPIGGLIALVNVPLIIAGFFFLNKMTMIKTMIAVFAVTVMTDYAFAGIPPYQADGGNGILAAVFGGALLGTGLGLVYNREGTTGGMDIVNKIINRFMPSLKLGQITLLTDGLVIAAGWVVYRNLNSALYAVISVFVSSGIINMLVYGGMEGKLILIFSERSGEISRGLLELNKGVTILTGQGAYSGTPRNVVCTAVRKGDYVKVKRLVKQTDPRAFVVVTGTSEVLGEGFGKLG